MERPPLPENSSRIREASGSGNIFCDALLVPKPAPDYHCNRVRFRLAPAGRLTSHRRGDSMCLMRLIRLKQLFAALVLACFATLMGVECFHFHHCDELDQCQLCSITAQAVAHVAQTAPVTVCVSVVFCEQTVAITEKAVVHAPGNQPRAPPFS